MNENPNDQKQDKNEEIENNGPAPGVRDDDMDLDDGMDVEEPETVGARHADEDPESGKNLDKDDEKIPQDSDPSE